jgi:hypothetical protein
VPAETDIDIHAVDAGYSIARHILAVLDDASDDGMRSHELAEILKHDVHRVGAWLRDLRCKDWITKAPVSPGSYIVRWYITDTGRAYLNAPE